MDSRNQLLDQGANNEGSPQAFLVIRDPERGMKWRVEIEAWGEESLIDVPHEEFVKWFFI